MSLFLTKSAKTIVVAGICALVFMFFPALTTADDYRWDEAPFPEGDRQKYEPDPEICELYEENLRYFAKRNTPMSCERPIAPHLKDRIREVEWEDLDPDRYPDLFLAIATFGAFLSGTSEEIIQRDLKFIRAGIPNKVWVFRRAKLSLVGHIRYGEYGTAEPYWIVQYGPNVISPNNPDDARRCKPTRGGLGGGGYSNLELYIVSQAKHEFTIPMSVKLGIPSYEGQHLIMIDNRLFVENIDSDATIELDEVNTDIAAAVAVCVFQFKKSGSSDKSAK
ncbi:MAG: hypothetical protein HY913_00640 [Desulfomonile tiedjei]|nr:hypothetical protein [Desulfomonile tiedjei]